METRLSENEMEKVRLSCGFSFGLLVGCSGEGREWAGGLALLWNDTLKISITSFSLNHIHGKVGDDDSDVAWTVTGMYGFPEEVNKKKTWALIQELANTTSMWSESEENVRRYRDMERKHAELLKSEETIWRQRSRAVWLKDGDKNTKFFHGKANQRRKNNEIKKIKDEDGVWWHGQDQIEKVMLNFFSELFATSVPSGMNQVCSAIQTKLSREHHEWCGMPFTGEDVKEAIDQMHPLKAPGPDGLPALFSGT
jgi:hypothetical protein